MVEASRFDHKIIDGRAIAEKIKENLKLRIESL